MKKKFKMASLVMSSMLVLSSFAVFAGSDSKDFGVGSEKSYASLSASSTVATAKTEPYVAGVPVTKIRISSVQDVSGWLTGSYSVTATPSAAGIRGGIASANSTHRNGAAYTTLFC